MFTVLRQGDAWVVEHGNEVFGHAEEKSVAEAWAHKRARAVIDGGGAAQVCVRGDSLMPR